MRVRSAAIRWRWVVAAGTAVAAASLLPAAAATGVGTQRQGFTKPVALPDGKGRTEPSVVVDRAGRIYVSAVGGVPGRVGGNPTRPDEAPGTPVWVSTDGGREFVEHATCSAGPLPTNLSGGDSALVLDKRGYVYGTDLWLGDDSGWFSTDHGQTCVGSPVSHRPVDDRNWLAYSPRDDAIYQVYDGIDGLWVSRADLNTAAGSNTSLFDAVNVELAPEGQGRKSPYERAGFFPPGGIAADPRTGAVYVSWPDQFGIAVARSVNKGLTWSIGHIPGTSVTGDTYDDLWNFSPVATDDHGTVYVSWSQVSGSPARPDGIALWLAWSTDQGQSWHKLRIPTRQTAVFPALAVYKPGKVAVGWVDSAAVGDPNGAGFLGERWRLAADVIDHLRSSHPTITTRVVDPKVHRNSLYVGPQGGDRGMGDFFSMAVTPAGSLVVAYARGQDGQHGSPRTSQTVVSVLAASR